MEISVDDSSPVPPFEQVRAQVEYLVTNGALRAGARLPTVRQLASDLALAPNTVARAYRALEEAGLVVTNGRRGTVVADVALPRRARRRAIEEAASRYRDEVIRLGGTFDDALRALASVGEVKVHGFDG
ncbi:MAG TPA: GntR family transcriptional regulator [Acidimicrobiales bacterium]|jgi:GntR family transcriptional regulator|nr:GntR family transcriptional regulator [Acidimicrobiales bacterium]